MGCGCGGGGGGTVSPALRSRAAIPSSPTTPSDCIFTSDMVNEWLTKVQCVNDNGVYVGMSITQRQINIYLGTLKSAKNYPTNICYYQKQLADVSAFITALALITTQC